MDIKYFNVIKSIKGNISTIVLWYIADDAEKKIVLIKREKSNFLKTIQAVYEKRLYYFLLIKFVAKIQVSIHILREIKIRKNVTLKLRPIKQNCALLLGFIQFSVSLNKHKKVAMCLEWNYFGNSPKEEGIGMN